ncbi:MAG: hypothetical protein Q7S68_05595, partial [Deltaproteobacteria bacterium]|nr:hypothetical protein [Deltaproteobacteria bacterium]
MSDHYFWTKLKSLPPAEKVLFESYAERLKEERQKKGLGDRPTCIMEGVNITEGQEYRAGLVFWTSACHD